MQFREESSEVLYATTPVASIGAEEVAFLKQRASQNSRRRCRLCSHPDPSASVQEMLIALHRSVYIRPHSHARKSESFLVVEGEVIAVMFDDAGSVERAIEMAPPGSGQLFYYRMPPRVPHSLLIRSEWLIFQETTEGPFDRAQMLFPDWAPAEDDSAAIATFTARIQKEVESHLATSS